MLKNKIGQLFILGYQGEEPSDEFLSFVEEWQIGGVIVFARNITDPEKLPFHLKKISEASGQPIFTAIDQEGGLVMRILSKGSLFPSAMGLAAAADESLTYDCYRAIAREMLSLGLNWNLAPVLDINHPDNPGIGARSFGEDADTVSRFGVQAIKGLQSAGVMACAKHFPGKGRAKVDSHLSLPVILQSADELRRTELYPFKKAIEAKVEAIMTAHVFFPAFEEAKNLPATLSKPVLTDLLRSEMGFDGIIVTDDLEMGAITESFGIAQAASLSFHAGSDLLLICHSLDQQKLAAEMLLNQLKNESTTGMRLVESLARIKLARQKIGQPSISQLKSEHASLIRKLHHQSVKIISKSSDLLPFNPANDNEVLFCCPKVASLVQVEEEHQSDSLVKIIREHFPASAQVVFEPKDSAEKIIGIIERSAKANNSKRLVFFSYNAHLLEGQLRAAQHFSTMTQNFCVAALRNPYDLNKIIKAELKIAAYSFRTPAVEAILKLLRTV